MWQQCQIWDGTYSLDDLLDAREILAIKRENEDRAYEAMEKER